LLELLTNRLLFASGDKYIKKISENRKIFDKSCYNKNYIMIKRGKVNMRRVSILLMALFLFLFLAACGQSKKVYELEESGVQSTVTFKHKDDEITEQTSESIIPYDMLGVSSKEEAEGIFDLMGDEMDNLSGISFDIKYKKDELIQKVVVDYEKADFGEMFDFASMFTNEELGQTTSMEEMDKMLKDQGYQEK